MITKLAELAELVATVPDLYVRYSAGPEHDEAQVSRDHESGLEMPGLSVNPLQPEPWWVRPLEDWLARQLCQYAHLQQKSPDERHAWVLTGPAVGRGPDCEPLIAPATFVAWIDDAVVAEARDVYRERFDVGRDSTA